MAAKLIAEEATLILKVEELTDTTRRLTDTRAQLVRSERMASVGRLAAGLAHEIGNPIAALMGMEDLLLEGDLDAEAQRDFLQRMRRETERIHVVVRDLLDFARPEGHVEQEAGPPVPADVGAVARRRRRAREAAEAFRSVRDRASTVDRGARGRAAGAAADAGAAQPGAQRRGGGGRGPRRRRGAS